jgi:hypothetical protein
MKNPIPVLLVLAAASLGAGTSGATPIHRTSLYRTSLCRATDMGFGTRMVGRLRQWATTTDLNRRALRDSSGLFALSDTTTITLVSDTTLCRRASEALRRSQFGADTGQLDAVHLIQYGSTRYVASPLAPIGEWMAWSVFDTTFAILGGFGI